MASSSRGDSTDHGTVDGGAAGDGGAGARAGRREGEAEELVRVAAFWTAVLLPFVALAVLASGLDSTADWVLFGALLAANLVALYLGHPHQER